MALTVINLLGDLSGVRLVRPAEEFAEANASGHQPSGELSGHRRPRTGDEEEAESVPALYAERMVLTAVALGTLWSLMVAGRRRRRPSVPRHTPGTFVSRCGDRASEESSGLSGENHEELRLAFPRHEPMSTAALTTEAQGSWIGPVGVEAAMKAPAMRTSSHPRV
ncbi:MAG: hypothetical protein ACLVAV_12790 [Clostridium sp.]